ncbi:MAG: Hsp20/alpha crystallin family protein [Planctomycetota bacterium]
MSLLWNKKNLPIRHEDHPFYSMQKEMNSLFDNFFNGFDLAPSNTLDIGKFSPSVDMTETEKEYKVSAELPGMDEKNVDLSIDENSITIKGEKKAEKEEKQKNYYMKETSYGSFQRILPLPNDVDRDKIVATFKKGVLSLVLPKTIESKNSVRKIEIKS